MHIRINTFKHQSKIAADGTRAILKYEVLQNIQGLLSIEVVNISDTHIVGIFKYENIEMANKGAKIYVENLKKESNLKFETVEGPRAFYVEKN